MIGQVWTCIPPGFEETNQRYHYRDNSGEVKERFLSSDMTRRARVGLADLTFEMKTRCFFAHVAFGLSSKVLATPRATANMLIEVNGTALGLGGRKRHLNLPRLTMRQKIKLAGAIAKSAALSYLKSELEFRKFPVRRFVDFRLTETPTYISTRPPPTKTFPDDCKVWRLAQCESDKLRGEPLI